VGKLFGFSKTFSVSPVSGLTDSLNLISPEVCSIIELEILYITTIRPSSST